MASASLLGLPTELKAHIVLLVAQQDDRFRRRVARRRELAVPILVGYRHPVGTAGKSLAMLSLVSKELRAFAAPYLFKELKASQTGDRGVVQYAILRKYPSAFSSLHFDSTPDTHLLESTLALGHTFTGVTSLTLSVDSARQLVCAEDSDGTLDPFTVDPFALGALRNLSDQISKLELGGVGTIEEAPLAAIVGCFPKLKHLAFLVDAFGEAGTELAAVVDSLEDLEDLTVDLLTGFFIGHWSQYSWTRPLRRLEVRVDWISQDEWDFIRAFSGSLEQLTLKTDGPDGFHPEDPQQAAGGHAPPFPRLHTLSISTVDWVQADVFPFIQYFSHSPISTLFYQYDTRGPIDANDPLVKLIATSLPTLRVLDVGHLAEADECFLQTFVAEKGIEIVGRDPPTLFRNPSAAPLNGQPTALEALKRVVDFARTSVERAERENDNTTVRKLLSIMGTLEDERLRWLD